MERRPSGQERDGVLRLLSLERVFCDERCAAALSDEKLLAAMARFEAELAAASAAAGVVPRDAAEAIGQACASATFDVDALAREARTAGTLAIPLVKALRAQVAARSPQAAHFLHFGATSQDVIDTAAALCLRTASGRICELVLELGDALAVLAKRHAETPTLARTLLQPASPAPFGWKAAMWLAPLARALPHFRTAVAQGCVLQFGGAAGTLSAFGDGGLGLAADLAARLSLRYVPTWHSARDGFARLGNELAILTGLAAKIARDVALLMQPEVAEAMEPSAPGRGGSSSMPHKRNPSGSMLALEAVQRSPGLAATLLAELAPEHERGLGQWQGQWFTLRELVCAAGSALAAMAEVVRGLEVNGEAMRANLTRTRGLVYSEAVSLRLGRTLADRVCEQAVREERDLIDVMRADEEVSRSLNESELDALFQPQNAYGSSSAMIERALADWLSARESSP